MLKERQAQVTPRGHNAVLVVPQLAALLPWPPGGGLSRLLAAPHTRHEPLGRRGPKWEPAVRPCGPAEGALPTSEEQYSVLTPYT